MSSLLPGEGICFAGGGKRCERSLNLKPDEKRGVHLSYSMLAIAKRDKSDLQQYKYIQLYITLYIFTGKTGIVGRGIESTYCSQTAAWTSCSSAAVFGPASAWQRLPRGRKAIPLLAPAVYLHRPALSAACPGRREVCCLAAP